MDNANIWKIDLKISEIEAKTINKFFTDNFVALRNWFEDLGHNVIQKYQLI